MLQRGNRLGGNSTSGGAEGAREALISESFSIKVNGAGMTYQ